MRRITSAKITHISLCKRGMNKQPVVFKAEGDRHGFAPLVKAGEKFDERGEILAVVYPPNYVDAEGDTMDVASIEKMQRESTRDGFALDIQHNGVALKKSEAWIAENFLIAKGDSRFEGWKDREDKPVDLVGGWAVVVKVEDPILRTKYRSGEWDGVSMFGPATFEPIVKHDAQTDKFLADLAKHLGMSHTETTEDDMKIDELNAALAANNDASATALVKALTAAGVIKAAPAAPASGTPAPAAPTVIKFEGDPSKAEDVAKHAEKVTLAKMIEGVDWSNPASIAEYQTKLAAHNAAKADAAKPETDEVKALKKQIAEGQEKLRKATGQSAQTPTPAAPEGSGTPTSGSGGFNLPSGVTKADIDAGSRIAKLANSHRFPHLFAAK